MLRTLARTLILLVVALVYFDQARAEQLGMELLSTSMSTMAYTTDETPFDEIVVFGTREERELPEPSAVDDDVLERVLRDLEVQQELEMELEWREKTTKLDERLNRLRVGFDPREAARGPAYNEQRLLPMDVVMPATVMSVDF